MKQREGIKFLPTPEEEAKEQAAAQAQVASLARHFAKHGVGSFVPGKS